MSLLVLLAALPAAATVSEACDESVVVQSRIAPASSSTEIAAELDRRAQRVLAEARRVDGERTDREALPVGVAAAAVVGLALLVVGLGRRKPGAGLVGLLLFLGAAGVTLTLLRRALEQERTLVRLGRCQAMLDDARRNLLLTQLSVSTHRLGEVDEDLSAWESTLRSGGAVSLPQILKMREELKH